jgi:hypothetical protein
MLPRAPIQHKLQRLLRSKLVQETLLVIFYLYYQYGIAVTATVVVCQKHSKTSKTSLGNRYFSVSLSSLFGSTSMVL